MRAVVVHCREAAHIPAADYVYCGRPTKWGNPYAIGSWGTRQQVIEHFRTWWYADAQASLRLEAVRELAGKSLGCWCAPKPCHVDVIAEFVNRATGAE